MARSDSKLKNLPQDLQAEMWRMLTTPVDDDGQPVEPSKGSAMSQEEVRQWLEDVHGVSSSSGAFSGWKRWYRVSLRFNGAKDYAADAKALLADTNPELTIQQLDSYGDLAFRKMAFDLDDAELFAEMRKLTIKDRVVDQKERKLNQDDRRIQLLEKKAAFADEVKRQAGNREGGITAADMEEIERKLKLL